MGVWVWHHHNYSCSPRFFLDRCRYWPIDTRSVHISVLLISIECELTRSFRKKQRESYSVGVNILCYLYSDIIVTIKTLSKWGLITKIYFITKLKQRLRTCFCLHFERSSENSSCRCKVNVIKAKYLSEWRWTFLCC